MLTREKAESLILKERARQLTAEKWSDIHDNAHKKGELSHAAQCYYDAVTLHSFEANVDWPWEQKWWKPTSSRKDLVKAGALIDAEIARLQRFRNDVIRALMNTIR